MRVASEFQYRMSNAAGLAAQQIVVHDEEPDQIVLAHEIEGLGHVVTFKVAETMHVFVCEL